VKEVQETIDALDGKKFDLEVEKEKARKRPPIGVLPRPQTSRRKHRVLRIL